MILSDKCREDFLDEYGGQQWEFNEQYEMVLVIEFLDSKEWFGENFYSYVFERCFQIRLKKMSFNDVCMQAISICNDHYNENIEQIKAPSN